MKYKSPLYSQKKLNCYSDRTTSEMFSYILVAYLVIQFTYKQRNIMRGADIYRTPDGYLAILSS